MLPTSSTNLVNQLRRYKRLLIFGGGLMTTLMLLIAFAFAMLSSVRAHIAAERQAVVIYHDRVMEQVRAAEASFRIGLVNAELAWSNGAKVDQPLVDDFRKRNGEVLLQPAPAEWTQRVFAVDTDTLPDESIGRYLALAEQLSRSRTIHSLARGRQLPGYFYTVDHDIAGLMPSPGASVRWPATATTAEREKLIAALADGLASASGSGPSSDTDAGRQLLWKPPRISLLTGTPTIRLVGPLLHNGKPFATVVTEYDASFLTAPSAADPRFDGVYMIVAADGTIVDRSFPRARDAPRDAALADPLRALANSKKAGESWHYGVLTISAPVGNTGWMLVHTCNWQDIVGGISPQLALGAALTLIVLIAVWSFLMSFRKHAFRPALDRSQRLFESEQLSRTLIETAPVGLALISLKNGRLLARSPAMVAGARRVTVPAATLAAELAMRYRACVQTGERGDAPVMHEEITLPTRDQDSVDLAVRATPSRYQGEDVLVVAVTDVTAYTRVEQHLREAREAADSANAAKSAFLAAMSHEIRTPLNAVLGNLELLAQSSLDALQHDRLTTIRAASEGLLEIVSDVLDFSKIEAGEMTLEDLEFDALDVVARSLSMFAPAAQAKELKLFANLGTATSRPMRGDPTRLAQVINNLLSNAIKFTARGEVTVRMALLDPVETSDDAELLIEIEDTGIGMSAQQQAAIFQPFSQADRSINRRFGGTGLGLALCARLAGAMGGEIAVHSALGGGSCFSLRVPQGAPRAAPAMPRFGGETVTLVAASEASHTYAIAALHAWGLAVDAFRHPVQVDTNTLERTGTLILLGERDTWHPDDELRLIRHASRVIDCTTDGPLHPVALDRLVRTSSFSLAALANALQHTLRNQPLTMPTEAQQLQLLPRRLKVLVAEDNVVNRRLFAEQMAVLGCNATVVEDGARAVAELSAETFDVLITDLSMPLMDGYALAREAHRRWPCMPVVAATASVSADERERCKAAGFARMVTKPLSLGRLRATLAEVTGLTLAGPQFQVRTDNPAQPADLATHSDGLLGYQALPDELRQTYLDSFEASLAAIAGAQRDNDAPRALAELHSLTGALGVFRQYALAGCCAELQSRIKQAGLENLGGIDIAAHLRDVQDRQLSEC
ncbi:response regulator [Paraburkholderia sp. MMS20-SJTR3]|uniref:histidine kinase n=1 Tax=Paraburkholderia sejongensis TaxID=2886946 RepID=A0ABS8K6G5_9BURK|nr:ATP-binding protein [Paraburkholderia sp. MMS20-SJTR3]MCC8397575.1 response regulator [Paraburkholderia sp. MMS20-SJTR3]